MPEPINEITPYQQQVTDYLLAFISGIKSAGVRQVVISPGSRSTPLAVLLYQDMDITTYIDIDERSAAFFALGLSKVSSVPIGLVCTSGTAAANYYPAICEAEASFLSLLVMTTDRPPELRQVGAPQAMDQNHLYASHVKNFMEMSLPEKSENMLEYIYWQGKRNTLLANQQPKGVVHLNFPLRKPLLPNWKQSELSPNLAVEQCNFFPKVTASLDQITLEKLRQLIGFKKGIIILGGAVSNQDSKVWLNLAEQLQWPIIGDPLTNLANCGQKSECLITQGEWFTSTLSNEYQPDIVLRSGVLPVSKNINQWLEKIKHVSTKTQWILMDQNGNWYDSLYQTNVFLQLTPDYLIQQFKSIETAIKAPEFWLKQWQSCQKNTHQKLLEESELIHSQHSKLMDWQVCQIILEIIESETNLFLANSNTVRFFDRFQNSSAKNYSVYGNRGANGIDGTISTVMGVCASQKQPTILVTGDLTLFHDMNGLWLAKKYDLPITIVLLNNNGGGIFSFLEQNQLPDSIYQDLFQTPLDLDFEQVAILYGAKFTRVFTTHEFQKAFNEGYSNPKFQIIEVVCDSFETAKMHQQLFSKINASCKSQNN